MSTVKMIRPLQDVRRDIALAVERGDTLLSVRPSEGAAIAVFREDYFRWESKTAAILESSFQVSGFMTSSPKDEFSGTAVSLLDLKISSTTIPPDRVSEVLTDIREKIRVLKSIDDRLEIYEAPRSKTEPRAFSSGAPIFLVHGHNLERRELVRRFLETVTDRKVVVLSEQPNRGQDILGKLLANAQQAGFAVVLLTPDDVGGLGEEDLKARARQNVVFELGLFIGLLGRDRVAALNDPGVEVPTDFAGVAYIPLEGESWQFALARELKAGGIGVSLDDAV